MSKSAPPAATVAEALIAEALGVDAVLDGHAAAVVEASRLDDELTAARREWRSALTEMERWIRQVESCAGKAAEVERRLDLAMDRLAVWGDALERIDAPR